MNFSSGRFWGAVRGVLLALLVLGAGQVWAAEPPADEQVDAGVSALDKPLYSPFIERYVLDEVRAVRVDIERYRSDLLERMAGRELELTDRAVTYATDTVTYFFYLIAAASSVLIIIGWNSMRELKEQVKHAADEKVSQLIAEYESRLERVEKQIRERSTEIQENQEEIAITNEVQSLWVRANQETSWEQKIRYYDAILKLRPDSAEALTHKADAALELSEPHEAIALCNKALEVDETNAHAYFQLACAYADLEAADIALEYLAKAVAHADDYRTYACEEVRLELLREDERFHNIVRPAAPN